MKGKSKKRPVNGTLRTGTMIEITDPAEQAALDRRCEEAERMLAAREQSKRPRTRTRK